MRTRTTIKYTKNLTDQEYAQCFKKNLGNGGTMRHALAKSWREKQDNSKVVLIKDEHKNILAWSLTNAYHMGHKGVMFWVEPTYRRQGLGTRLLAHSKKVDPQPYVFPHDRKSGRFFKKHLEGVRVASFDRYWIDN